MYSGMYMYRAAIMLLNIGKRIAYTLKYIYVYY